MGGRWDWHENWAHLEDVPGTQHAFAHHGLAVTDAGDVVGFHARQLVVFDREGHVIDRSEPGLFEGHQITCVREDDDERFWIADPGICLHTQPDGNLGHGLHVTGGTGRAVLVSIDGDISREIPKPPLPHGTAYMPTSVAVDERAAGGNGDVWVADGYGSGLVHRYDEGNRLSMTLDGEAGAGRFDCPHAVFIDRRRNDPELCVADRGNGRVQVFDLDGTFVRSFGRGVMAQPSSFAVLGDTLLIADLCARLALFDPADELIEHVGDNIEVADEPGWPNELDHNEDVVRTDRLRPGKFNSPHAVAVDGQGSVFVAEWLVGGRYTKLTQRSATS